MGKYLFNAVNSARMHFSRMRTVRCSGRLSCHAYLSFTSMHTPMPHISPCHACPLPHMPTAMHTSCHACPHHTCPCHTCPLQCIPPPPCTPNNPAMHTSCHTRPLSSIPLTMHASCGQNDRHLWKYYLSANIANVAEGKNIHTQR